MKKYDVFGVGAALMDFLIEIEDNEFIEMNLKKGEMRLIEEEESKAIMKKLKRHKVRTAPGGSTANVLAGVATLGGSAVFCGKIGADRHGEIYEQESIGCGVSTRLKKHNSKITGHSVTFITPDSERTFATHLGASIDIEKEDVLEEDVAESRIMHLDCYQIEDPKLNGVTLHAVKAAKKHNTLVSVDLADPGVVKRNLDAVRKFVKEHADIVFANEEEAKEFAGTESGEKALHEISKFCDIAVVKLGKEGSLIKKGEMVYSIPPFKANAVDTTGAGDMYAAGVLLGIANNFSLEKSGKIGSWAASKVVSQVGARLDACFKDEIKKIIDSG